MQENRLTFSENRLDKIKALKKLGVEPYPAKAFNPSHPVAEICQNQERYLKNDDVKVQIAGRIFSIRNMSKSAFIDISDDGATINYIDSVGVAAGVITADTTGKDSDGNLLTIVMTPNAGDGAAAIQWDLTGDGCTTPGRSIKCDGN